jgi:EAL domain-containing protein (putative c-di-GMP-specific phosphodiesterase class I)
VITATIGIAIDTDGSHTPGELLREADVALYAGKAEGKNRSVVHQTSMDAHGIELLELESDLRQALERHEFEVYYQPMVNTKSGAIVEVEALVRWHHPRRGLVFPAEFIPLAESTSLIVPLGRWVLEQASRDVRTWQLGWPSTEPLELSVNLSARQLQDPELLTDVRRILSATGLDPQQLRLEITESIAVDDGEATLRVLHALRDMGIRLAIDDFGTGNSALSYLQRFPVDTLKIDRSFVQQLGHAEQDRGMVQAVIAFAKTLGLSVTGEGVETADQLEQLRMMGCDLVQGYYFARPVPAGELIRLLVDRRLSGASGNIPRAA